jgi:uncharacterized protein (DUF2267 family)
MNSHKLISKFIAQICEKQYAFANSTLATILEAKLKEKIAKEAAKQSGKKSGKSKTSKQEFLARMAKGKKSAKKGMNKDK